MYCSKCGKELDYDALVCRECEQAEQTASVETPADGGNPRMRGFGKALAGCILSFAAIMTTVFVYIFGIASIIGELDMGRDIGKTLLVSLALMLLSMIPDILAIVYGIRSIRVFRTTPIDLPKPIATLVAGIHSIAFGVVGMIYAGIFSIVLIVIAGMAAA